MAMHVDATEEPALAPPKSPAVRAPAPVRPRSTLAGIRWDDLRVKGWAAALTLATAYVSTKPDRYGWLAPVLTAWAAASKPPRSERSEGP